jgi:hypothetical protein
MDQSVIRTWIGLQKIFLVAGKNFPDHLDSMIFIHGHSVAYLEGL